MKHPSIRELFDYWNERRGGRDMPERADIEPAAIRRVLADTFILSFEPAAGHPFRIAGTFSAASSKERAFFACSPIAHAATWADCSRSLHRKPWA